LETFIEESGHYQEMAELVERIDGQEELTPADWEMIKKSSSHLHDQYSDKKTLSKADRSQLIENIIDSFGPGRVMFRNTRKALKGFPQAPADSTPARFT
jgi:ATP-dependent helicase HepA